MPVYAEFIQAPSEQDAKDLALLYPSDSNKLLQRAAAGKLLLVAGRFNGRLLAALTLTPIHGGDYEMARLTVRDITRRRGVARQLLVQTLKVLPEDLRAISADLSQSSELVQLFAELGFNASGTYWRWRRPQ